MFAVVKEVELQGTFFVTANDPERGSLAAFQVGEESFCSVVHFRISQQFADTDSTLSVHHTSKHSWFALDKATILSYAFLLSVNAGGQKI